MDDAACDCGLGVDGGPKTGGIVDCGNGVGGRSNEGGACGLDFAVVCKTEQSSLSVSSTTTLFATLPKMFAEVREAVDPIKFCEVTI